MFVVCLGEYGTSFGIDKHPSCKVKNLVSHVICDKERLLVSSMGAIFQLWNMLGS